VTAQHDPELPKRLSALGDALERRFELRRDPGDEDQALALRREAARQAPTDARVLAQLAECLRARYQRTSEPTWLAEALHVAREAVAHSPATGDEAADSHNLLGNLLDDQFDATSDPSHLAGAAAYRSAVEKMPPGDPDYAVALVNAGRAVLELGKVTRATERLDEAVVIARAARRAADVANPGLRMQALVLVAHTHEESHSRTGCPQVAAELAGILDELRTRLNAPDVGDLQALLRLADVLLASPARSGRPADLDLVIEISERVKADPGVSAALQGEAWRCLCQALRLRANHTGSPADLAAAVRAGRQVTAATPEGHPAQVDALAALSVALIERASRTGSTSDAEEAVHFGRQAARLANARQEAAVLANLASALQLLYVYTERLGALSESIEVNRRAVALLADGAADRASLMNNLGSALLSRHQRMGNPDDLDAAIEVARSAVAATASRGVRAQALHNLASALTSGYESVRDPAMLDEIVRVNREAVECTDPDHAGRAGRLVSLGRSVRRRFESGGAEADLAEAMTALREALAVAGASPATRASAALELADLAGARENWIGAVEGYAVAIGLLPRIAWLGIERSNREDWLRHLGGVGSAGAAAALTLGDPRRAIELLEQGRTVLWNQDLLLRDERSALAEGAPELNETLDSLAAQLNADERPNDMVPIAAPEYGGWRFVSTERRQTLAGQWEATLDQVRALPGFGDFLTIPPADVLQRGVGPHPVVVVNVHPRRSDAIIVTGESATALPLPDLRYREVERRAEAYLIAAFRFGLAGTIRPLDLISAEQTLLATLEWLWDVLAEPVLAALGHDAPPTGPDWPRVVWCPTGLLALLPLHAAGYHDPEDRASGRAVLDRVISSHTPSLRALARGCDGRPGEQEMLVVAVPDAEGLPDLPGARAEAYALIRDFPHLVKESLVDSAATRDAVTRGLAAGRSVHFACHGSQQVDAPASGAVHLADDTLTIADIAALRLDRAEFAYLSACQTAVGGAELPDEAIHLAAALQLAGYRRVIGTLWTINDQTSVGVARQVYELMLTPSGQLDFVSSATALHHAVRDMRAAGAHARLWAPYVHFGP
jgi:tetratricopeptide (TPR) repeat protein